MRRRAPKPPKPEGAKQRNSEKLPSLDDVAREVPKPEEMDEWFTRIDAMADREAALAYGALIEAVLEDALSHRLRISSPKRFSELFRKPDALLGSWSAKTVIAHTLGLLSDEARTHMDRVRRIRNAFAHAIRPVSFDTPTIAAEALKLDCQRLLREDAGFALRPSTPRGRYFDMCELLISHHLAFVEHVAKGIRDGRTPASLPPFRSKYA